MKQSKRRFLIISHFSIGNKIIYFRAELLLAAVKIILFTESRMNSNEKRERVSF